MKTRTLLKAAVALTLIAAMLFAFAACGGNTLEGSYVAKDTISGTITFTKDGGVTMSALGLNVSGTYVIENGSITFTYEILGISTSVTKTFSRDGKTIVIDGQEFVKQ